MNGDPDPDRISEVKKIESAFFLKNDTYFTNRSLLTVFKLTLCSVHNESRTSKFTRKAECLNATTNGQGEVIIK